MTAAFVITVALSMQQPGPVGTAWTDDRPLTQLWPNLRRDVTASPRRETLAIVGAGILGALAASPADDGIARWVGEAGQSKSYTPIGALIGNEWFQGAAAIAAYAIGRVQKSPEIAHVGSDLIRAQLLNGVFTIGTKLAASRTRPDGGRLSFPSGHTSATFASATVLAGHYGWKVAVPAYAVAGFIGWTRIRDHQHYLTDVIVGTAIGIAAGKTVMLHRGSGFTVTPAVVPGGGGIFVVRSR